MQPRPAPWPLAPGDLEGLLTRLAGGASFREGFEQLLLELPDERAEQLLQLHAERRGAWLTLLCEWGGRALLLGNSLTGAVAPLAAAGFSMTLADAAAERLVLAGVSAARHGSGVRRVQVAEHGPLPFKDRSFDLVVLDDDHAAGPTCAVLGEARRVCAGELVVLCDNRLAYKRSSGRWQDLRLGSPLSLLLRALLPRGQARSLRGQRRAVEGAGFGPARALALYPDRRDFAHVVDLDGGAPSLWVGPNEARNRLKVLGLRLGLFPLLTPSFALLTRRVDRPARERRIDHVLGVLAQQLDEPQPRPEHLFATRGNTAVIQTAVSPPGDGRDPAGRWTLHVPLHAPHRPGLERHIEALRLVRERFPAVPVPEPLHVGWVEGLWVSVERRLPGLPAQHWVRDPALADRVLLQAAEHLAELVTRPPAPLDEADFERLIGARCLLVAGKAPDAATRAALADLLREARANLIGAPLPRVLQHGDLRAKHVQAMPDGAVLGYVDWGTASRDELPGFDLVHLLVHDAKQRTGEGEGVLWRRLLANEGLRAAERRALDRYAELLGYPAQHARSLLAIYPILVGAIAESNWPWTRPRWFRRTFDL
jgi:aminoglycoside phosphotransferase (APT) family kinase protein